MKERHENLIYQNMDYLKNVLKNNNMDVKGGEIILVGNGEDANHYKIYFPKKRQLKRRKMCFFCKKHK